MFSYRRRRSVAPCSSRRYKKKPSTLTSKVLGSGDVLLSHGLSPYYHRGCSVSLPCSEWERVVPLRYCHQTHLLTGASGCVWWRNSRLVTLLHRAEMAHSAVATTSIHVLTIYDFHLFKELPVRWHLHTGSKLEIRMTNVETLRLRFVLRSFLSSVCRSAKCGTA